MNRPWDIILELQNDNSRLIKEAIIRREASSNNDEFFAGVRYCLDNMITFGIKQVPESDVDGDGLDWIDFKSAIDQLVSRNTTGNDARDLVNDLMKKATIAQWNNWYRRILIKDLRCGVSDKTVNVIKKTHPQYEVPVFGVQLAHDGMSDQHAKKVCGKKLISMKLDGCLSADWVVEFEDGTKVCIKDVVENRIEGKIKSYNEMTGKIEYNEILNWASDGQDDSVSEYEWFVITLENGYQLPPLTGNHLVYVPKLKCYRRVDELTVNDSLLIDLK